MFRKCIFFCILLSCFFSSKLIASYQVNNDISLQSQYTQLAANSYTRAFPAKRSATGRNVFIFDPRRHRWAAYNKNGQLVKTGKASGGKTYCKDLRRACRTPAGVFSVYAKRGANCKSSKFPIGRGGAPMPYCTFFRGGYAIHGSYNVPNYNASHGCVRVVPSDAKWLQSFLHYGSTVIVRSY
ncbi:MAG: L,D-transpeptidase [Legionellales bacterium]|nr:L,D-transpeptidase [Legionellales bacterium]|tara:strand:- start:263 stop:811 length:549 start_codon:yes stop_codon:yes gene_type:complete